MADSNQFDDKEKLNVLLKSAFEVTSTQESTPWYNETTVPFNNYVEGNTILIDDIPSNPDFNTIGNPSDYGLNYSDFYGGNDSNNSFGDGNIQIDSTGVLVKFKKLILEPTGTHNKSYYKMGTINNVSVNLLADSFQFTKNATSQGQPFEYTVFKNDNTGTNKISKDPTGGNYFFDFKSGIVFFPDYDLVQSFVDDTKPPLFTFVRYIGKKGVANLSSGSFMPTGQSLSVSGDIYYDAGNVGIGTNSPIGKLQVKTASPNPFVFDGKGSWVANLIGAGYKFKNITHGDLTLETTNNHANYGYSPTAIMMGYFIANSETNYTGDGIPATHNSGIGFLLGNFNDGDKQPSEVCNAA